jgi:large subunit ribosomal protein L10
VLRKEKAKLIDFLTEEFKNSEAVVIADYKGLTVKEIEALRNSAKASESNIKVKVVKNTLASIALNTAGVEGIELVNTNIVIWGDDQIAVSKVASKFADDKKEKFIIKDAVVEGKRSNVATIEALSKLPGKDELIGMLLSVWTAPIRNFVTGLDNLKTKKEEEAA